jgi:peptidoglycan/LPS O-acetylase OafA/YrhL
MQANGGAAAHAYFPAIDLLRFASAIFVALFHLGYSSWISANSNASRLVNGLYQIPEGALFWWGNVGVQIFFVISGFVIAASANGASPFSFARSRIERLYPAVWVCASVTAAVWIGTHYYELHTLLSRYLRSVTLWPFGPWIDGQYWTLRVEIGFYLCVFALVLTDQVRRFEAFACALVALGGVALAIETAEQAGLLAGHISSHLSGGALGMLPIYYGSYFGLGMLLWLRIARPAGAANGPFIGAALVVGAAQVGMRAYGDATLRVATHPMIAACWFAPVLVWLAAVAIMARSRPLMIDRSKPSRWSLRLPRLCGLTTYPLYLIHFGFGVWIIRSLVIAGLPPLAALLMALILTLACAAFVADVAEPTIRRVLRRLFGVAEGMLPARAHRRAIPVAPRPMPSPASPPVEKLV